MDWANVLLPWFDRWLKGDRDASLGPRVEVEDSTERWRSAADWPDGRAGTYWLNPEHELSPEPSKDSASEFVANDPFHTQGGYTSSLPPEGFEDACVQPTCVYFETAKLKDEFHFAGLPELDLKVVPQGPGGQLSAYIYAASEDGFERLGWGQLDLRFRDGSNTPKQVTPGQEMRARILFQPLDAVAPAGSRLLLVVSGGTGWNRLPSVPNYPVEILEGAKDSRLELVEVNAKPGDFFKP
jgi:predicted acyl esterase